MHVQRGSYWTAGSPAVIKGLNDQDRKKIGGIIANSLGIDEASVFAAISTLNQYGDRPFKAVYNSIYSQKLTANQSILRSRAFSSWAENQQMSLPLIRRISVDDLQRLKTTIGEYSDNNIEATLELILFINNIIMLNQGKPLTLIKGGGHRVTWKADNLTGLLAVWTIPATRQRVVSEARTQGVALAATRVARDVKPFMEVLGIGDVDYSCLIAGLHLIHECGRHKAYELLMRGAPTNPLVPRGVTGEDFRNICLKFLQPLSWREFIVNEIYDTYAPRGRLDGKELVDDVSAVVSFIRSQPTVSAGDMLNQLNSLSKRGQNEILERQKQAAARGNLTTRITWDDLEKISAVGSDFSEGASVIPWIQDGSKRYTPARSRGTSSDSRKIQNYTND
jgi:hypothetical protein